jgi:hypothetical protein
MIKKSVVTDFSLSLSKRDKTPLLTSGKRQIPSLARAAIQPRVLESGLGEELPRRSRVEDGVVGVEDAFPAGVDIVYTSVAEVLLPFFLDECLAADVGRYRRERDHVDSSF